LTQPLLQGFGRNNPLVEQLTQAERDVVYAIRSFSQYQKQFDITIVNDYFNLLSRKSEVRNNYTNYLRRVDLTQYTEARAVDRIRAADVEDARTAELAARIAYINSVAAYLNELDGFKLLLGLPLTESLYLDDADLDTLERTGLLPVNLTPDAAFHLAVEKNLDLLNSIDQFEDSKRKLRLAIDQLKPTLNFAARASLASDGPDDYTKFDLSNVSYAAELSLDNLVDKLPARNNYRAGLISYERQVRALAQAIDNLRNRIERGFRRVQQERQNYINRQASLAVAARRVDMNQTLFQAGRAQVRDLREAQDALISAQNELTDSIASYQNARLLLLFDIGVLNTSVDQFWLKDALLDAAPGTPAEAIPSGTTQEALVLPNQVLEPTQ
jgi:outer membrane protein TolC